MGSVGQLQDMVIVLSTVVKSVVDVDYYVSNVRLDARGHVAHEESYCRGDANEAIRSVDAHEELVHAVIDRKGLASNLLVCAKKLWLGVKEELYDEVLVQSLPIDPVSYFGRETEKGEATLIMIS